MPIWEEKLSVSSPVLSLRALDSVTSPLDETEEPRCVCVPGVGRLKN